MNVVPSEVRKILPRMNQTCGGLKNCFLRSWLISFDFPMMSSKEALGLKEGLEKKNLGKITCVIHKVDVLSDLPKL